MPDSVWADTERDGDRHIKRKAAEYQRSAETIASNLRQLAQLTDADESRRKKVQQTLQSADVLKNQFQDLAER